MKLLFFIDGLRLGGKERRILELLNEFISKDRFTGISVVSTLDIIAYPVFNELDIKYYLLKSSSSYDPRIFYKFFKLCREIEPDIVHCWSTLNTFYSIPAKVLLKFLLVNSQITNSPERVNWWSRMGVLTKINFHFSDSIIANSYSGIRSYAPPIHKSRVIYNSFNFNRINDLTPVKEIREKFSINTNFVIAMVAAFNFKKDYNTYIKSALSILTKRKDITFLCIGEGDSRDYQNIIGEDFKDNIKFLGKQNNVESIMNICDVGVLNTFTEGISNSILEFMALGKPVVVSGKGGCNEIVENGKNGYLIEPENYKKVAEKILMLLDDENLRVSFGEYARKIVSLKFSVNNMFREYSKVYGI